MKTNIIIVSLAAAALAVIPLSTSAQAQGEPTLRLAPAPAAPAAKEEAAAVTDKAATTAKEEAAAATDKAATTAKEEAATATNKAATTAKEEATAATDKAATTAKEEAAAATDKAASAAKEEATTATEEAATKSAPAAAPATEGSVARSTFTREISNREPTDHVTTLTNDNLQISYFTELRGLGGHTITHRWIHGGKVMAEVPFQVGSSRWRVYSSKELDPGWIGTWKVETVDETGKVLASDTFTYEAVKTGSSGAGTPADPVTN